MPRNLEHQHQVALFNWAAYDKRPELKLLYAVPNSGKRDGRQGAWMKAEGLKAGVPDIVLPVAWGGYHALYIELKVGKNKPTPEQAEWLKRLYGAGNKATVCYGWDSAKETIERYLAL
jgi:hypothetical protein